MFWLMGMFWLLVFAVIGGMVGWELKGLMVEHREREESPVRPSLYGDVSRTTVDIVGAKADELDNVLREKEESVRDGVSDDRSGSP